MSLSEMPVQFVYLQYVEVNVCLQDWHDFVSSTQSLPQSGTHFAVPLLMQLHDAHATPGKLPKFIVEALYGAGNKASAMLPTVMHVAMPEGCTEYRKWMLSAAFCARLVTSRQLGLECTAVWLHGLYTHHQLAYSLCRWFV